MSEEKKSVENQDLAADLAQSVIQAAQAAAAETVSTAPLTIEEQLAAAQAKITELTGQVAQAQDQYLRAKAETDNTRRRAQVDVTNAYKYASEGFAEALLPVKDSLEAALLHGEGASLEKYKEGVELTLKQLSSAFEKGKVTEISPVGEKFDPHKHQAISMVPAPEGVAANHVVTVLQKGYLVSDRVLRPALVTVAQGA